MTQNITFSKRKTGSLAGRLLIATAVVQDSSFARSVVLLCSHNEAGAMGVIINHPVQNIRSQDIMEQLEVAASEDAREFPVQFGGPVEAHRGFVVHSDDYKAAHSVLEIEGVSVTSNATVLQDMAKGKGPKHAFLALGYAGWSSTQLESEIESGSWIVATPTEQLIFHTENDTKWNLAVATLGFDMGHFSHQVGHA